MRCVSYPSVLAAKTATCAGHAVTYVGTVPPPPRAEVVDLAFTASPVSHSTHLFCFIAIKMPTILDNTLKSKVSATNLARPGEPQTNSCRTWFLVSGDGACRAHKSNICRSVWRRSSCCYGMDALWRHVSCRRRPQRRTGYMDKRRDAKMARGCELCPRRPQLPVANCKHSATSFHSQLIRGSNCWPESRQT